MPDISALQTLASTIATEYDTSVAAHAAETAAKAALLTAVIEAVRPALRAISYRPKVSEAITWHGGNTYTDTEETYAIWRGVCLSDAQAGPGRAHSRDNSGAYNGCDLFLRDDGRLVQLAYSGTWSKWQGTGSSWEAACTTYPAIDILTSVTSAIEDGWEDVDAYISLLSDRLTRAVGSRTNATKAARARAEQLAALAALVRK